ncbi:hypothetical protein M271_20550 [Streptomyces rapamycinicus NRRL 5491]|nr:hypothetical protein M271_20550 [Streptomyces rapamycinicus NRRL 5491]
MGHQPPPAKMASLASAAPSSRRYGSYNGLSPDAPSRADRAPPALVPEETMRSVSPGTRPWLWRRYRTAALRSTMAAGATP